MVEVIISGIVAVTFVITAGCVVESICKSKLRHAYNMAELELRKASLDFQRTKEQQDAQVECARAEGRAHAQEYIANGIHKALEALKAPSVIVQR